MSQIDATSEANAVGVGAKNEAFSFQGENVTSRIGIAATFDPSILTAVADVPQKVISEADAGTRYGFGFPAHLIAKSVFKGTNGVGEVYIIPQTEVGTVADGEIAWSGAVTAAGSIYLRISNRLYLVAITDPAATLEEVSDAVVAFVNAVVDCPVIAAKTAVTFETTFTAKAKGLEGNNITITLYAGQDEALKEPTGLVGAVTPMANGITLPDIQDSLDGLGTDDDANEIDLTMFVHGNGIDTDTIDAIAAYVGDPNTFTGCWSKLIGRPFVSLNGDIDPGDAALTALEVISDARITDPNNGIIGFPDEDEHPIELAGFATGLIGKIGQNNPAENYSNISMSGVGGRSTSANRWTKNYTAGRDGGVKNGISPTIVRKNQIYLQNVVTFYRPTTIPSGSNGFKSVRSFWITRNILFNIRLALEGDDWQGITIVNDKSRVTDSTAKLKARDLLDVRTLFNNLTDLFVKKSYFFDDVFPKEHSVYSIRALNNGFDVIYKWKMSGELQIVNVQSTFDTNISS